MSIPQIEANMGDVKRKYLGCAIDISDTNEPKYLVAGYRITDSVVEFNGDVETITDILGDTYTTINKFEPQQSFDPHRLTSGDKGKLAAKLIHYQRERDMAKFGQFKCILIYGMLEKDAGGGYHADLYESCTITPQSIGGESWVDMPFQIYFGGNVVKGTVDKLKGNVEFTPTASALSNIEDYK